MDKTSTKDMLHAASQPYTQCATHSEEMMESSIACLSCNQLVCALCMRDSHINHNIISVIKLRDCMAVTDKVADDLNELQVCQKRLQTQIEERKKIHADIEASNKKLCSQLESAFEHLATVIQRKKEEIKKYIATFTNKNIANLKYDLKILEQRYTNSTRMIQKVITCTTLPQLNVKEMTDLPNQLKSMLKESRLLADIQNVDTMMAETKFAKVLPSLHAVSNICQTLHPEATKVVWSKVTPEKDNGVVLAGLKRRSSSTQKVSKKLRNRSPSPHDLEHSPVHRLSSEFQPHHQDGTRIPPHSYASTESPPGTPSLKHTSQPSSRAKRKSVEKTSDRNEGSMRLPDSSTGTPDVKSSGDMLYKYINVDLVTVKEGHFVMGQNGVDMNIGRVVEVTRLHSLHFVSVQWYHGVVGKNHKYTVSEKWIKKSDLVNSDGLVCSFEFDPLEVMDEHLEKELLKAGEDFKINSSTTSPWSKKVRTSRPSSNSSS